MEECGSVKMCMYRRFNRVHVQFFPHCILSNTVKMVDVQYSVQHFTPLSVNLDMYAITHMHTLQNPL